MSDVSIWSHVTFHGSLWGNTCHFPSTHLIQVCHSLHPSDKLVLHKLPLSSPPFQKTYIQPDRVKYGRMGWKSWTEWLRWTFCHLREWKHKLFNWNIGKLTKLFFPLHLSLWCGMRKWGNGVGKNSCLAFECQNPRSLGEQKGTNRGLY